MLAVLQRCIFGGIEHVCVALDTMCLLLSTTLTRLPAPSLQALRPMCGSTAALQALDLPNHWIRDFFLASQLLELQQNQEALGRLQRLSHVGVKERQQGAMLAAGG